MDGRFRVERDEGRAGRDECGMSGRTDGQERMPEGGAA
jgi:hypothetical protein